MPFLYKCILMVGATSGIGLGMVEKLIREGSKVIAVSRRKARVDEFISKHGSNAGGITTGSNLPIVPARNMPAYSAWKAALDYYTLCLREQLTDAGSNVKVLEVSPPPVQTELQNYMGFDKRQSLGTSLDKFSDEAYDGLASGKDQVVIGSIRPQEKFMDMVDKRRGHL